MNIQRILDHCTQNINGCLEWDRSVTSAGYGQLTEDGEYWSSHRYTWTHFNGPIPKGKVIRHLCHNRRCCNILHLDIGTHVDNHNDSLICYTHAGERRRHNWFVDGIEYPTCRAVVSKTGLSMHSVIKYTENGVFDLMAYREATRNAGWVPKV